MSTQRGWLIAELQSCSYYFSKPSGLVIGQIFNFAHTPIWGAKIYPNSTEDPTQELFLGQYVNREYAKDAVVNYWDKQDRTLREEDFERYHTDLLTKAEVSF